MHSIRTLAPTIVDALQAVEMGCRLAQHDNHFVIRMNSWMTIFNGICYGCLATCTLMRLSHHSASDVVKRLAGKGITAYKSITDRSYAYNIAKDVDELELFEQAIDLLRHNDLYRLLKFYHLHLHPNADLAMEWLLLNRQQKLYEDSTEDDLLVYADFLKDQLIPNMKNWFGYNQ